MRWALVGSREYRDLQAVREVVRLFPARGTVIVSGGARGVDQAAAEEAKKLGLPVVEYLPDWHRHGRAAGMIRNRQIVANADAVIAFWDGQSRGTRHTVELANKVGIPVYLFKGRRK